MNRLVAVVGSANLDITVTANRRPHDGETLTGSALSEVAGGKGARLQAANVDTSHLQTSPLPTGRAFITVTPDGENSIIVLPLANADIDGACVTAALNELQPTVVLTQLEVPFDAVLAASRWASAHDARFLLNPSPIAELSDELLTNADPLIVDRGEAEAILKRSGTTHELARELAKRTRSVIVADGRHGAVTAQGETITTIPAPRVTPVDTTGAGDCFAGTVAAHLATGEELTTAAEHATLVAARIVQLARSER